MFFSIGEFLTFATKVAVERTQPGQRQSVKQEEQVCHVYVRGDGLAGVITSDKEYPSRVAFTVLSKVCFFIYSKYFMVSKDIFFPS